MTTSCSKKLHGAEFRRGPPETPEASKCCEKALELGRAGGGQLPAERLRHGLCCPSLLAQPPSGECFPSEIPGGFVTSPFPGVGEPQGLLGQASAPHTGEAGPHSSQQRLSSQAAPGRAAQPRTCLSRSLLKPAGPDRVPSQTPGRAAENRQAWSWKTQRFWAHSPAPRLS